MRSATESRFTGRQITTIAVAIAVAVIAFPVSVFAATGSLVNITDPVTKSHKARVDASGRLKVGDGSGLLSVDGTLNSRPLPPAQVWSYAAEQSVPGNVILPITGSVIEVTSLTVTAGVADASVDLSVLRLAGTATNCGAAIQSVQHLYLAEHLAVGMPLSVSFPTPLQSRPAGQKLCLHVAAPNTTVSVSGYYGG
jgi:hypothetical protein